MGQWRRRQVARPHGQAKAFTHCKHQHNQIGYLLLVASFERPGDHRAGSGRRKPASCKHRPEKAQADHGQRPTAVGSRTWGRQTLGGGRSGGCTRRALRRRAGALAAGPHAPRPQPRRRVRRAVACRRRPSGFSISRQNSAAVAPSWRQRRQWQQRAGRHQRQRRRRRGRKPRVVGALSGGQRGRVGPPGPRARQRRGRHASPAVGRRDGRAAALPGGPHQLRLLLPVRPRRAHAGARGARRITWAAAVLAPRWFQELFAQRRQWTPRHTSAAPCGALHP